MVLEMEREKLSEVLTKASESTIRHTASSRSSVCCVHPFVYFSIVHETVMTADFMHDVSYNELCGDKRVSDFVSTLENVFGQYDIE